MISSIFSEKKLFFDCVKKAFNQRRKKLKNSLKKFKNITNFYQIPFLDKRAEELSVQDFIQLVIEIEKNDHEIIKWD